MRIDTYGQFIFNDEDLCSLYLRDTSRKLNEVLTENDVQFSLELNLENLPKIIKYEKLSNVSIEQFDSIKQDRWFMPGTYKEMDIAQWVLDQCTTQEELQRAGEELLLFQERGMFDLLRYMKYFVDVMRKNNVVWGVGRGSSVASFVLFLIGVHKINSLHYQLAIDEFLK